jgi:hypothetical protein
VDRHDNHVRTREHFRNAVFKIRALKRRQESLGRYPAFAPRWLHGQLDSSLRSHYIRPVNNNVSKISSSLLSDCLSLLHAPSGKSSMHDFYWIIIRCCYTGITGAQAAIRWIYLHIMLNSAVALPCLRSASRNCARGGSMASCGFKRGFPAI